jgi:hypothetical protein
LEVPPSEQRWSLLAHEITYQNRQPPLQQIRGESTATGTGSRGCVSWRFIDIWQHDDRKRGVPNPVSSFYVHLRDHFFTFPIWARSCLNYRRG